MHYFAAEMWTFRLQTGALCDMGLVHCVCVSGGGGGGGAGGDRSMYSLNICLWLINL